MSFSELSRRKKDEKCANLHIVVHVGEEGQGLQHLMVVLHVKIKKLTMSWALKPVQSPASRSNKMST